LNASRTTGASNTSVDTEPKKPLDVSEKIVHKWPSRDGIGPTRVAQEAKMTTFTIYSPEHGYSTSGLSAVDAARELLFADNNDFEIRAAENGGFELWISRFSRSSACFDGLIRSAIFSAKETEAAATEEISLRVINSGIFRTANIDVMTDENYSKMMADISGIMADLSAQDE
jgi:hypothetical protein